MKPSRHLRHVAVIALAGGLIAATGGAHADKLDQIMQIRGATHVASAKSQKKIDKLADETKTLLNEYRAAAKQVDSLRKYNDQLDKLVQSQREEMASLQEQIDGIVGVERDIRPLMDEMVDMLSQFVDADVPFLREERTTRIASLRELLLQADVTVAEQYRKVIEAYQIENNFGHTIEAYRDTIQAGGEQREVDYLRIGRLGLYYRSLDGEIVGMYDKESGQFVEIDSSYSNAVKQGLRVARKQAPPDLMVLPVRAAGGAE
jgi:septal ring factor EnvC (AmiA/AmiB activator)